MTKPISIEIMKKAFTLLDRGLSEKLTLIMGGGGSMIFAHGYPLATTDVDAIPLQQSFDAIDPLVKKVALDLNLPGDWLNPYFSTFTHVLPSDYANRLIKVFHGAHLTVQALGRDDMLIMKCFAHRQKDLGHARALIKAGANLKFVEEVIEQHRANGIPQSEEALDFLDGLKDELE